jgi:hypothetical protein
MSSVMLSGRQIDGAGVLLRIVGLAGLPGFPQETGRGNSFNSLRVGPTQTTTLNFSSDIYIDICINGQPLLWRRAAERLSDVNDNP